MPIRSTGKGKGLSYRWYDADKMVLGKRMEDQLRFAVCYWHSFTWPGGDAFGGETFIARGCTPPTRWRGRAMKADVAFDMFRLLDVPFFSFHDRDIAPEGASLAESNRNVREIGEVFARKMEDVEGPAALGHRQPLLQPPLHGGGGDQSRSRESSPMPRRR